VRIKFIMLNSIRGVVDNFPQLYQEVSSPPVDNFEGTAHKIYYVKLVGRPVDKLWIT